jgi:hypothetical protein
MSAGAIFTSKCETLIGFLAVKSIIFNVINVIDYDIRIIVILNIYMVDLSISWKLKDKA